MMHDNNIAVFFELLGAGLWEKEVRLDEYKEIDWQKVYSLASEQGVIGLVLAGLDHSNVKPPQQLLLQWIGEVQLIEQRNKAMNVFVAKLIDFLRKNDIYALLIKGQGVAQNYERPLWRSPGDVDLYLSKSNYEKAMEVLLSKAEHVEIEDKDRMHIGMTIEGWIVELHGTMHTFLSKRVNNELDNVHRDIFIGGNVRSWINDYVCVFLPRADEDAIIVFTHFLNHFYGKGIGLRQVCDWCRLLWIYKDSLDNGLLESRIRKMGLLTEWMVFESFACIYLGMPKGILLEEGEKYSRKAERLCRLIFDAGNLGHKSDESYKRRHTGLISNILTFWHRMLEYKRIVPVFPPNTLKFFIYYITNRVRYQAQ